MAIKYFMPITDDNHFVHSIDMVKIFYSCYFDKKRILGRFEELAQRLNLGGKYYANLDKGPSVRWNYWQNHIHLDYIYIRLGKYARKKYGNAEIEYDYFDVMTLEVNPNKHYEDELFVEVMKIIDDEKGESGCAYLSSVDYAIDVACNIDDVVVLRSRKLPGLYKGTRYYGIRSQNGFVKIYDKAYESGLTYPLTRIETFYKVGEKFSSVDFGIINHNQEAGEKLSKSTGLIVDMLKELQLLGSDNVDTYLDRMIYHTRKQVIDKLSGTTTKYLYDNTILLQLLSQVKEFFGLTDNPKEKHRLLEVDSNGFLTLDEDDEDILPFC